jgi:hypothetical protein
MVNAVYPEAPFDDLTRELDRQQMRNRHYAFVAAGQFSLVIQETLLVSVLGETCVNCLLCQEGKQQTCTYWFEVNDTWTVSPKAGVTPCQGSLRSGNP